MNDLRKRVAYLKGLLDGLNLDSSTKEGRLFMEFANVFEVMAEELHEMRLTQVELEDYMESVDEDLYDLEDELYDQEDTCLDTEEEWIEVDCPNCGETVCFETEILEDEENIIEVTCPNCDGVVFVNDEEYQFEENEEEEVEVAPAVGIREEDDI